MTRRIATSVVVAAAAVTVGCASTTFTSTWKAPDAAPVALAGKKVAAMVVSRHEATRRAAEDALARAITARGATAVTSYSLLDATQVRDEAVARAAMQAAGIDGVVVMRAVGRDREVSYTPPTWMAVPRYRSFWGGYYGYGWGSVYDPGYLQTNTIVSVETLVYALSTDSLLWAGTSETTNPSRIDSFITEVAGKVADQMRKDGVLR